MAKEYLVKIKNSDFVLLSTFYKPEAEEFVKYCEENQQEVEVDVLQVKDKEAIHKLSMQQKESRALINSFAQYVNREDILKLVADKHDLEHVRKANNEEIALLHTHIDKLREILAERETVLTMPEQKARKELLETKHTLQCALNRIKELNQEIKIKRR